MLLVFPDVIFQKARLAVVDPVTVAEVRKISTVYTHRETLARQGGIGYAHQFPNLSFEVIIKDIQ